MSETQATGEGTTQNADTSATAGEGQQTTALNDGNSQQQASTVEGTTGEGDPAASGNDSQSDADGGNQATEGAPEKYEFKAPEGLTLNESVISEFSEVAKELNLSQDAAQKLVEKLAPKIAEQNQQAYEKAVETARTSWRESVTSDKEFGGEKLHENLSVAKKALDAFGSPELRSLLEQTGLGDNPEIIRAFYRAGKAISEDKLVSGGRSPNGGKSDAATVLYSNQKN